MMNKITMAIGFWLLLVLGAGLAHAAQPGARIDYAMAYFPPAQAILMHGGWSDDTGWDPSSELWKLDASGWTQITSSGAPAFAHHSMTYDSRRQVMVLCGNTGGTSGGYETWEYDGAGWTQKSNVPVGISGDVEIAYDAARGVTVLYGADPGWEASSAPPETWTFDGSTWTRMTYAQNPVSCGDGALLKYDEARQTVVLVGNPNNPFTQGESGTETWLWNGSSWSQVSGVQPGYAVIGGMAYDSVNQEMVLLSTTMRTWTFNGTAWTEQSPAASPTPSPNGLFGMAYDPVRQVAVFFGGESSVSGGTVSYPTTTWEWNGSSWAQAGAASTLDGTLTLTVPAIEFMGTCYQARLNYYQNPADAANIYWVLDMSSLGLSSNACGSSSATLAPSDLAITLPVVAFSQAQYRAGLVYYANPADSANMYWRLNLGAVAPL
ncbi:MAG: hypothetical protein ACOY3Z_04065 [Thermodesulfobacteriota bacterium]